MESTIAGIAFTFFGLVGIAGSVWNWELFTNPAINYRFISALGPRGMRIFYGVLGLFLFGVGLAFLLGFIRFGAGR